MLANEDGSMVGRLGEEYDIVLKPERIIKIQGQHTVDGTGPDRLREIEQTQYNDHWQLNSGTYLVKFDVEIEDGFVGQAYGNQELFWGGAILTSKVFYPGDEIWAFLFCSRGLNIKDETAIGTLHTREQISKNNAY